MIDALPLLLSDEGYQISRSVRLRSSASAYFSRTLTTPTNNKIWTWSAWVKRGRASGTSASALTLFATGSGSTDAGSTVLHFDNERLVLTGYNTVWLISNAVYRDPSAWYHIVVAWDNSNATASNRIKIYVNGLEISYATDNRASLSTTATYGINQAVLHTLGAWSWNNGTFAQPEYYDGYLTEINFIDGQALTPASFGETNPITGVWQPKKYTGTYGTNGFYLNFSDPSAATAAAIGKDYSGNGNNWTPNNISVTAGVTYDSMLDVPTQWADGGNGRGNYAVLNPVDRSTSTNAPVPTNGNLAYATASVVTSWAGVKGTISFSTGKYYFEDDISSLGVNSIGFAGWTDSDTIAGDMSIYFSKMGGLLIRNDSAGIGEAKMVFGTTTSFASGADATNGLFQLAIDFDAGKFWIGKNNTWFGSGDPAAGTSPAGTFTANREMTPLLIAHYATTNGNITHAFNAGQRPFAYTPPSGFKALNTLNLPTPTILKGNQFFNAVLYTGNGSTQSITGVGFQPDLVWGKSRSNGTASHRLYDAVRGVQNALSSNLTSAEFTESGLTAFNSDGFSIGSQAGMNENTATMVAWNWKEGATQGFDIVLYTGTGSNTTFAHSLGVAPRMIIVKNRTSGTPGWAVYHASVGNTGALSLNQTTATDVSSAYWNNTSPTSSVFSVGTGTSVNTSAQNYVAYLFAEVAGFSKAFSYTGNGSADGPFIFLGFRPRWVMVKRTDVAEGWQILDTARNTVNVVNSFLEANQSNAEGTSTARDTDYTANGFKVRNTSAAMNASGGTYIGMAFAEAPFKFSLGR